MANNFGSAMQELRRTLGITLYLMAQKLGVSSAFLSSIENGKKRVPENFVDKLIEHFPEAGGMQSTLTALANKAREQVILPLQGASYDDADLATALARKFSGLTEEQKKSLRAIIEHKE